MDADFIQARIDALKTRIVAYEEAILAVLEGGQQSYTFNTGQTQGTVTRLTVSGLQRTLESAINQLVMWQNLLNGGGGVHMVPGW